MLIATMFPAFAANDWVVRDSASPVPETADKLIAAVEAAGAKLVARVDHAANATSVGASLEPTILVIFGNPKVGTPIIQADRRAALELPIRILIWQEGGRTRLGYRNPQSLKAEYGIKGADEAFVAMTGALEKLTTAASKK
jgi:uncharacterized protein (DUF302 family)